MICDLAILQFIQSELK